MYSRSHTNLKQKIAKKEKIGICSHNDKADAENQSKKILKAVKEKRNNNQTDNCLSTETV